MQNLDSTTVIGFTICGGKGSPSGDAGELGKSKGDGRGKNMEKNLTSGSVLKNIFYFSLPYLLSYFLQTLYGMADLFIIGQFEGIASTTAVMPDALMMELMPIAMEQ